MASLPTCMHSCTHACMGATPHKPAVYIVFSLHQRVQSFTQPQARPSVPGPSSTGGNTGRFTQSIPSGEAA